MIGRRLRNITEWDNSALVPSLTHAQSNTSIYLCPVNHNSPNSAKRVQRAIEYIKPHIITLELDKPRAKVLSKRAKKVELLLSAKAVANNENSFINSKNADYGLEMTTAIEYSKKFNSIIKYIDLQSQLFGHFKDGIYKIL